MKHHRLLIGLAALVWVVGAAVSAQARITTVPTAAPDWYSEGDQTGDEYGFAVAAGDVDGDGFSDLIVGSPKYDAGTYREGAAFLFRGSAGGLAANPVWIGRGGLQGGRYAHALSSGDVNGDGYDDLLVGAPAYRHDDSGEGVVFLYFGSPLGLNPTPDWQYESNQAGAELGWSVSAAGDLNQDGFGDVAAGARWFNGDAGSAGAVFIFYGAADGLGDTPDRQLDGDQAGAGFGWSVAGAGDVNGDGYDDLLVGAPYYDVPSAAAAELMTDAGRAFLFAGSANGVGGAPTFSASGSQPDDRFGSSVSSAGNVNGDNCADFLIGASLPDQTGAAYLWLGAITPLAAAPAWQQTGGDSGDQFGYSLSRAGDVNQDGYDDVLIGIPGYTGDQAKEGAAAIYLGGPGGPGAVAAWRSEGNKADTLFGAAVAAAGDINQDGYGDVAVGAQLFRQDRLIVGRAFAYHGAAGMSVFQQQFLPLLQHDGY